MERLLKEGLLSRATKDSYTINKEVNSNSSAIKEEVEMQEIPHAEETTKTSDEDFMYMKAYLQQELEKLQDMRNKAKLEGELWDDRMSSSSGQNTHMVSKATRLWESLLARKSQHEILASGPIEDLIAHRDHRYRISGSSLLAAMDLSSHVPYSDVLSVRTGEMSPTMDPREQMNSPPFQGKNETLSRADDRGGRVHPTVDVAEILRRWTHALQRIHKQSLHLAKANDGEGPELLHSVSDGDTSGHAESLAATLAEHRQHLLSIQV